VSVFSTATVEPEKFTFESNVARVMDIIIHSLYSSFTRVDKGDDSHGTDWNETICCVGVSSRCSN
jgi:hypothetical protein